MIGGVTSLLTATYMFRLVFLTFHGERRHAAPTHARTVGTVARRTTHLRAMAHASHGAASHLHDAPPRWRFALIVLALGSVLAGYIGVPHALGGHNALAAWLAPRFEAVHAGCAASAEALRGAAEAEARPPRAGDAALELTLMGVSSVDRACSASASPRSSG